MRILALLLISPLAASAQDISFNFNDGSTAAYPVSALRSAKFSGDDLHAFLWDGTILTGIRSFDPASFTTGLPPIKVDEAALTIYPNPTHDGLTLSFAVQATGQVKVEITDAKGAVVATIQNGTLPAGWHSMTWNGSGLSGTRLTAGAYQCRVIQPSGTSTQQVILQH